MKRNIKKVKDDFITIARMTQPQLKTWLRGELTRHGYDVITGDGYLYARGDYVLLTAHMDTVHEKQCKKVQTVTYIDDCIISAPNGIGGDDRCGVWSILDIVPRLISYGIRPAVLFCEDEEIGGVGSGKFCKTDYIKELSSLKYLIEIDRKGSNDAVFYDDGNYDFHEYIEQNTGCKTEYGSFSDISILCPACGVSGVNLSSGYYNPHMKTEYVVVSEMVHTADVIVKLVKHSVENDIPQFKYIDAYDKWDDFRWYAPKSGGYGYDDVQGVEFSFYDEKKQERTEVYESFSFYEAVGQLMVDFPDLSWNDVYDYQLF